MTRLGRYEILEEIGRGGFASVYKVHDTRLDRVVALKTIQGSFTKEPAFVRRFRQEARTAANLRHPNIVPVYDFGDIDGTLYLAMACVGEGRTLRDLLVKQAPMSLEQALPILAQLADALDYLHQRDPPLTHRDIKPANVLLEERGDSLWVVLTDFGLVHSMETSRELTRTGTILGTPAYLAPEQVDSNLWGDVTPLTDVYALGVVVYEMLTGQQPFVGELATVIHAHASKAPPQPLELVPELGTDLAQVLMQALAKPPKERHPTAGALIETLRQVADVRTRQELQRTELVQLLSFARAARDASDWLAVQDLCVRAMQIDRAHPEALEMMAEATAGLQRESVEEAARRERAQWYEEGQQALTAGRWQAAIKAFDQVAESEPDYRDIQEKLAQASDEYQRAQWYDEAIDQSKNEHWSEACRLWVQLLRGRFDYRDGDAASRLLDATDALLRQHDMLIEMLKQLESERDLLLKKVRSLDPDSDLPQVRSTSIPSRVERPAIPSKGTIVWARDDKEMVHVPAGVFLYGDDKKEIELPEFWIDKTPVTNAEYARFVADAGQKPPEHWKGKTPPQGIADHPVTFVDWENAAAYAEWAGKRLPTEEEWEKAARGTDGREYPWGNQRPTSRLCNFGENEGGTTIVGRYSPQGDSPYGCVDIVGNVWEWTASDHHKGGKVLRGGSWLTHYSWVRCATRHRYIPDYRYYVNGFRGAVSSISSP